MIKIRKAEERYSNDHGWLKTNFSFSFADYYDPNNMQFGPLRVLNDDIIAPQKGFGSHPHREMEIVSIVLDGFLKHEDSTGTTATTTFGGVQRMSAGTGIIHSEVNPSLDEDVNLLQLWFLPEKEGLPPSYEKTSFDINKLKNNLLPVVSKNTTGNEIAKIHQDLTIYLSDLEEEKELSFEQLQGRRTYIFVIEGKLLLNEETQISKRDDARITETSKLKIKGLDKSRFMLIDLP
ncbi:pirin family protein [Lottiidibacillus patelloidae]|uniref:Pirin family protein n=1 Tax=Lottiidibacillus patelloidae TaxID=2670334 RepID=A0A263BRF1_9BACI|nr:pirin family protein [Lottiidibacillus patelloidae]OZM56283.1 pirin family protein [Lottiidibacillus patelloidae]